MTTPTCEVCQHRDSVYLCDIEYGRLVALCATCVDIFPEGIILEEADTDTV